MHHSFDNETTIELLISCSDLLIIPDPGTG